MESSTRESLTRSELWTIVHSERQLLIEQLREIPTSAWDTRSLCADWSCHDVLAHLVDDALCTRWSFTGALIRARFDFDRLNAAGVRTQRRSDPHQTLSAYAAAAGQRTSAPAPPASRFVESVLHGEDLRRPLGLNHTYPPVAVRGAMLQLARTSVAFGGGKERMTGLRLVCSDLDLRVGAGREVSGRSIDLLLALSGRTDWPTRQYAD